MLVHQFCFLDFSVKEIASSIQNQYATYYDPLTTSYVEMLLCRYHTKCIFCSAAPDTKFRSARAIQSTQVERNIKSWSRTAPFKQL